MNIFCNSEGVIFNVTSERIFQGSAGANKIYFIGQFPASSQVMMSYHLPNGVLTHPKLLTPLSEITELQSPNGGKFSIWEGCIGASPQIKDGQIVKDGNGNIVYDLDYSITENHGRATIQFYVYDAAQGIITGGSAYNAKGKVIATASTTFDIEKGVPVVLPDSLDEEKDVAQLLEDILGYLANTQVLYGNAENDIKDLQTAIGTEADGETEATGIYAKIAAEASARQEEDGKLDEKIATEATTRESADKTLAENIAKKASVISVAMDNTTYVATFKLYADSGDAEPISTATIDLPLEDLNGKIDAEATERAKADNKHSEDIETLKGNVSNLSTRVSTSTAKSISVSVDPTTYVATFKLLNASGGELSKAEIDLPLESMVVGGYYDDTSKKIKLGLQNGGEVEFSVDDLVGGLAPVVDGKIPSRYIPENFKINEDTIKAALTTESNKDWTSDEQASVCGTIGAAVEADIDEALDEIIEIQDALIEGGVPIDIGAKNIEDGTGKGAVQQVGYDEVPGAVASGDGAVAFGGKRFDKASDSSKPQTEAKGKQSFASGGSVVVEGDWSAGFGKDTKTHQRAAFAEGGGTVAGNKDDSADNYSFAHAEGEVTKAIGRGSHAEGYGGEAHGFHSHAEGVNTKTTTSGTHAEGIETVAGDTWENWVATNPDTTSIDLGAFEYPAHAEGYKSQATGYGSHAEGGETIANGVYAHTEGYLTEANEDNTHAEGALTKANGPCAHAEGFNTSANGDSSHAGGRCTIAGYDDQTVIGRYNKNKPNNIFEVGYGDGDAPSQRKNVFEVDKDGEAYAGGKKLLREGEGGTKYTYAILIPYAYGNSDSDYDWYGIMFQFHSDTSYTIDTVEMLLSVLPEGKVFPVTQSIPGEYARRDYMYSIRKLGDQLVVKTVHWPEGQSIIVFNGIKVEKIENY